MDALEREIERIKREAGMIPVATRKTGASAILGLATNPPHRKQVTAIAASISLQLTDAKGDTYEVLTRNGKTKIGDQVKQDGKPIGKQVIALKSGTGIFTNAKGVVVRVEKLSRLEAARARYEQSKAHWDSETATILEDKNLVSAKGASRSATDTPDRKRERFRPLSDKETWDILNG